jgi:hypothetical protein
MVPWLTIPQVVYVGENPLYEAYEYTHAAAIIEAAALLDTLTLTEVDCLVSAVNGLTNTRFTMTPLDDLQHMLAITLAATPSPVAPALALLDETIDPQQWIAESVGGNTELPMWSVMTCNKDFTAKMNTSVTAVTGNGLTSEANAVFYAACHNNMLQVLTELLEVRSLLQSLSQYAVGPLGGAAQQLLALRLLRSRA